MMGFPAVDKGESLKLGRFYGLSYAIELIIECVFGHAVLFLPGFIRRCVCDGLRLKGISRFA